MLNAYGSFSGTALVEVEAIILDDQLSVALPAFAEDGSPVIPPDKHVLDHLSRTLALVEWNAQIDHPFAAQHHTVCLETGSLPGSSSCDETATHDGPVVAAQGATHASMWVRSSRSNNSIPPAEQVPQSKLPSPRAVSNTHYRPASIGRRLPVDFTNGPRRGDHEHEN